MHLQYVLEAKEDCLRMLPSSALKVRIYGSSFWGILQIMSILHKEEEEGDIMIKQNDCSLSYLVRICCEDEIVITRVTRGTGHFTRLIAAIIMQLSQCKYLFRLAPPNGFKMINK